MKIVPLVVIVCLAGGAQACGQKGPLVMPDQQKHKRTVPTLPRAPAKPGAGTTTQPAPAESAPATSPAPPAPAIPSPSTPAPPDSSSHP